MRVFSVSVALKENKTNIKTEILGRGCPKVIFAYTACASDPKWFCGLILHSCAGRIIEHSLLGCQLLQLLFPVG